MRVVFTSHALFRMKKRKILKEEVVFAIQSPDSIQKSSRKYYYRKRVRNGIVEIPVEKTKTNLRVITVYWV